MTYEYYVKPNDPSERVDLNDCETGIDERLTIRGNVIAFGEGIANDMLSGIEAHISTWSRRPTFGDVVVGIGADLEIYLTFDIENLMRGAVSEITACGSDSLQRMRDKYAAVLSIIDEAIEEEASDE